MIAVECMALTHSTQHTWNWNRLATIKAESNECVVFFLFFFFVFRLYTTAIVSYDNRTKMMGVDGVRGTTTEANQNQTRRRKNKKSNEHAPIYLITQDDVSFGD